MPAMPTSVISEVHGHPKEDLKAMAFRAVRRVRVTWEDRYAWANFFLYTTNAGNYPYFVAAGIPTKSNIIRIGIEPEDYCKLWHGTQSTSQAVYTHAILTLVYQSAGYDADKVCIESVTPTNEMQHVMAKNLYFGTGMPLGSTPSIHTPGFEYTLTYPRAKYVPGIVSYAGVINWDVYQMKMLPLFIYPFCGLYAGSTIQASYDYDGTTTLFIQHKILVRNGSWQYEWNPYTGAYAPVYSPMGVISKHAMVGFSGLF